MCDKYQELLNQSSVRGASDEDEERSAWLVGGQDRVRQLKHNLEVCTSILHQSFDQRRNAMTMHVICANPVL